MKPFRLKFLASTLFVGCVSIQLFAQQDILESALINKLQSTTYHALVIGIDDYGEASGIGDLMNPVADAKKFASLLTRKYHFDSKDIKLLANSSRSEIIEQLELLAKRVKPEDNVLIFYAGHGKMDESIDQGYWLPADAKISTRGNWISNDDIRDYIKKIPSEHTLLISDACFSGSLLRNAEESREIYALYMDVARRVLTSGNLETVPDKSVFLKYLMEELEENEKPFIAASQLYEGYRRAVINNSPNNQKPLYGPINGAGDKGGDFIFFLGKISASVTKQPTNAEVAQVPNLGRSEAIVTYGSIELTTEISGALYLDGKLMGNVSANSKIPINEVKVGTHTVRIVGSETQTREITVYKDRATTVIFEKKKENFTSTAGTFTDSRNRKIYKSIQIGTQVWMAENLDYTTPGSYVNKNGDRLYTWDAAIKACPAGWHLPSDKEWDILVNRFGGSTKAGAALKSTSGWKDGGNGTNSSGFTGLPAGSRDDDGIQQIGITGFFWSSTERGVIASYRSLAYQSSVVYGYSGWKGFAFSCRCVRD